VAARPPAKLIVTKGKAEQAEITIAKDTVYLGRLKEVSGKEGGLRRRNDIAFDDAEVTVSREHAHVAFVEGKFRLFHDSGDRGTRLFREGRSVAVPPAGGRGAQLKSGDEIHLGEARIRFEIT
jgi:predicted component of type VI protein secretion system